MDFIKSVRSSPSFKNLFWNDENIVVSDTKEFLKKDEPKLIKEKENITIEFKKNLNLEVTREDPFFFS